MRKLAPSLLISWCLLLAVVWLVAEPSGAIQGDAALRAARAGGAVLAWSLAALGAGAALVHRVSPTLMEDPRGWAHAFVWGLVLWGLAALPIAASGLLGGPADVLLAAALASGWLARPRLPPLKPSPALIAAVAIVALPALVDALAPAVDTDALYYHLGLPSQMLRLGGLDGGALLPQGNRPLALHLPFAQLLNLGGDSAPRLLNLISALACLGLSSAMGRAYAGPVAAATAPLLLAMSWSFSSGAGMAANNLPTALCALAALDAGLRGRPRALAIASGGALALKYTAAGAISGIFLIARAPLKTRVAAGLAALAIVSPWWARNIMEGVHPLFPFMGWTGDFPFQFLEKYGAGRAAVDWLALPWNAVMTAETTSFRFLGRVSPAWLALAPLPFFAARSHPDSRRLLVASLAILLAWSQGPQLLRYLLPGLPILAVAAGVALDRLSQRSRYRAVWLAGPAIVAMAGAPANLWPIWLQASDRLGAAVGTESPDAYLSRAARTWPAARWANQHLPADARVAVLFDWSNQLIARDTLLGSVEDHIPARHWLLTHGNRSIDRLRDAGVTHLFVGRHRFLRKSYPFVSDADFDALFESPVSLLDELLLRDATLIHEEDRTRLYRITPN